MSCIIVLMRTPFREYAIAEIPNAYKHQFRVEKIVDSLNARYDGWLYFTTREVSRL